MNRMYGGGVVMQFMHIFDIVCVYLCFYALLMMEPWHLYTSINSSCKDEHQMR